MSDGYEPATVPRDDPATTPGLDLNCLVCGTPLEYKGGRRPKYCPEHRKNKSPGTRPAPAAADARKAAAVLANLNAMISLGALTIGLEATAVAISDANDDFEEKATAALSTDPKLCATILRGGALSGKTALIVAYGFFAAQVVPTAATEVKEKRAERIALQGSEE